MTTDKILLLCPEKVLTKDKFFSDIADVGELLRG